MYQVIFVSILNTSAYTHHTLFSINPQPVIEERLEGIVRHTLDENPPSQTPFSELRRHTLDELPSRPALGRFVRRSLGSTSNFWRGPSTNDDDVEEKVDRR